MNRLHKEVCFSRKLSVYEVLTRGGVFLQQGAKKDAMRKAMTSVCDIARDKVSSLLFITSKYMYIYTYTNICIYIYICIYVCIYIPYPKPQHILQLPKAMSLPKPKTRNQIPETLNPKPEILYPAMRACTSARVWPEPDTRNPKPEFRNSKSESRTPQP